MAESKYTVRDVSGIELYRTTRRQFAYARAKEEAARCIPWGSGSSFIRGAAFVYAPGVPDAIARADWQPGGGVRFEELARG